MDAVTAVLLLVQFGFEALRGHAEVAEHHLHCPLHPGMYPEDHRFWPAGEKHTVQCLGFGQFCSSHLAQ